LTEDRPSILLTNDDGVSSEGILDLAQALSAWSHVTIVAPLDQESRTSRSIPVDRSGRIFQLQVPHRGGNVEVFAVDGTPAQSVQYGILEVLVNRPSLVIAGINYGENVGITSAVSGTIGAALEAATWGISAVAFSQQMPGSDVIANPSFDFTIPARLSSEFSRVVYRECSGEARVFKVDFPTSVNESTPWVSAFVSKIRKYDVSISGRSILWQRGPLSLDHDAWVDRAADFELGSDAHQVLVEGVVAVCPLTPDPTDGEALDSTSVMLREFRDGPRAVRDE
jgi:5'-nucleotidase